MVVDLKGRLRIVFDLRRIQLPVRHRRWLQGPYSTVANFRRFYSSVASVASPSPPASESIRRRTRPSTWMHRRCTSQCASEVRWRLSTKRRAALFFFVFVVVDGTDLFVQLQIERLPADAESSTIHRLLLLRQQHNYGHQLQ